MSALSVCVQGSCLRKMLFEMPVEFCVCCIINIAIASVHKYLCWVWLALVYKEWFVAPSASQLFWTLCTSLRHGSLPQPCIFLRYSHIVSLISFGAEDACFQLGAAAAAPAASCDAHAALRCSLAVAVSAIQPLPLQPLAVRLALCAFRSVVDAACRGAGRWLGGDGAQQVVPLP